VDALFKKEFDTHRTAGTAHPVMIEYSIDAVPFQHVNMDEWRENFKGMAIKHGPTGMTVSGAVDDIWINPAGELIVVDYKSTSKDSRIETLDEVWHEGYKRQMRFTNGFCASLALLFQTPATLCTPMRKRTATALVQKLDFEITLIAHKGSTDWVARHCSI